MAKVFERMVNRRLTTELESSGRLDKRQHAFRAGRGTDTYFAELERSLPGPDEHCMIASLDLSKAYDTTWRYGVVSTLAKWQIRGRMFNMIQSFLSERDFRVRVGGHLSNFYPLENGVPQGSVLSVTLFLVAIQPVFRVVPAGVTIAVYADDILLIVRGRKEQALHRKLQAAVRAVDKWAKSVGFTISAAKSQTQYCSPNARRDPVRNISVDNVAIPKTKQLRVLGVTLDRTLSFKAHCKLTKKACESRLRILKMIGVRTPRAQRVSLLQVGSAIITSRLLYGMGLISRGGQAALGILAPSYNKMVRYACGAYVTSPIDAMMAESGVLPFNLLAHQTAAKIAIRMLERDPSNESLPLVRRVSDYLQQTIGETLPRICQRPRSADRVWHCAKPSIVWDVKRQVRAGDPPDKVRPIVREILSRRFHDYAVIYTDGSKCDDTVGAGVYGNGIVMATGLPQQCSVFSAEAYAIKAAASIPNMVNNIAVLTDSASCLSALEEGRSKHPWIQQIEAIARIKTVQFCWIPGHAGVEGNIQADRLASDARSLQPVNLPIPAEDAVRAVKRAIRQHWDGLWFRMRDVKLRKVKNDTSRWRDSSNPLDQRVLTRLRLGHTRLTHSFLLEKEEPPQCCGIQADVAHIILHCRKYDEERHRNNIDMTTLQAALCNESEIENNILQYLKETQLFKKL